MNYWHMQLHPDDKSEWNSSDIRTIVNRRLIGCSGSPVTIFQTIRIGDYVLVRHGGEVIALTRVVSNPEVTPLELKDEYIWFDNYCTVDILETYENEHIYGKGWFIPKTLMPIDNDIAYDYVINLLDKIKLKMREKTFKDNLCLLKYKKQIILQGPPGTGKTRLAKEIALALMNDNPQNLSPKELIENFFKSGKSEEKYNENFRNRLEEFYEFFPKNQFSKIDLDDYCIGKSNHTNFCWWIEKGLDKYGKFTPGNSGNYVIYYSKEDEDYRLTKFPGYSISDIFPKIQIALSELAEKENIQKASELFGDSFIIKILNSYYPDKYFPINGRTSLINLMKIFDRSFKKIDTIELNRSVQNIFKEYKNKYPSDITNLDFMHFLYSKFDLKKDGNLYEDSNEIDISRKPSLIQFHPSYTYEDFVRGIVATISDKGEGIVYKAKDRLLVDLANDARDNMDNNYVLIIDEINRGNLSSVLGELIYALEYRGEEVDSMYEVDGSQKLVLPPNLYIIGTMNTADRSVGHIDYAIRRRFAFVDVLPEKLEDTEDIFFNTPGFVEVAKLFIKTGEDEVINFENAEDSDFLSNDFSSKDVALGHSYFIADRKKISEEEKDNYFKMKMKYEIIPILNEYLRDGVFNEFATAKIKDIEQRFA
ncbi:AAA family ATPase [Chryseobacterium sp. Hurlbut01]|uniref:AAA family ATPase n=1 Tax=Chryseobacterium sp. Hurlbut01 TaxID=1681828 RepID=UPI00067E4A45|nr:AAA family ATPase [Chryseobacterium sp. Hurlbut01]KNB60600.1 hypothetical protein AC804_15570 [Chryseobacterium sp. Hurlbut01]